VPTAEYSHLFDHPGVYPYYRSIHGTSEAGMVGAIAVTEPA
jgi:plastocyanin